MRTGSQGEYLGPRGEGKRFHNDELHSLYRSSNIVGMIKSRRLRWAGHVARMEKGKSAFKTLTGIKEWN